jgi:SlyX protein
MNTSQSVEQRLVELEIRLTYQQKLIDELNGIVTDHTMRTLRLEQKLGDLSQQNEQLRRQVNDQLPNLPHEKPPHY